MLAIFTRTLSVLLLSLTLLTGCHSKEASNQITIGTMDGPETKLMLKAQEIAEKEYHLHIKIVPFTDYSLPNRALADGDIDINMFQHLPFLDADMKAHGYDLKIVGKSFIYPMALYSKKIKSMKKVPDGAIIAVPNDPTNEGRALLLIQKAGLIKLNPKAGVLATPKDIISNPKHVQIKELDAALLGRSLQDVTLAAINTNYAVPVGLYPSVDGLFVEGKDSPYMNVFVVRSGFETDLRVQELLKAFQNDAVKQEAKVLFQGQATAGW